MITLTLFFPLVLLSVQCDAQDKLTNIDYLGLGYDIVFGNPHNDLQDPGFRDAIFELEYTQQALSSDGKWLVPDNVLALQSYGCGYETDATEIHGTKSYVDTLSIDTKVYGSFFAFKFSASTGYKQVLKGTSEYRHSYVSSVAKCLLYSASIKRLASARVTNQFIKAVSELPTTRNDAEYLKFISVFGTHYASTIEMGAKTVIRSEFSEDTWTKMQQYKFNFAAGAQASFLGFTGGFKFSTEKTKEMAETFDSNRTSMVASYMGCRPSSDGKWETWMENTGVSPYPIEYTLRPITELMRKLYFPNVSVDVLAAKANILNATYLIYCAGTPGCSNPDLDKTPVVMQRPDSAIIGTEKTTCLSGTWLLSCGLGNLPFQTSAEPKRCAVPFDNRTCECFANNGAVCQPWCTNIVQGWEIQASGFSMGVSEIKCPNGKKVVSCSIDPREGRSDEWQRSHFPWADGLGCSCFANNGARCIATCASNIHNYVVLSQYGMNNITVECPPQSYALGCGIRPLQRGSAEQFRTYSASTNSCNCYDRYGATCYAVCGQFET